MVVMRGVLEGVIKAIRVYMHAILVVFGYFVWYLSPSISPLSCGIACHVILTQDCASNFLLLTEEACFFCLDM